MSTTELKPTDEWVRMLTQAPAGTTLRLSAGEFRAKGPLTIARGISLEGAGPDRTRLSVPSWRVAAGKGEVFAAQGIAFEQADRLASDLAVMTIDGGEAIFEGCRFHGAMGLRLEGWSRTTLRGCDLVGNRFCGIGVNGPADAELERCTLAGNGHWGVVFDGFGRLTLRGNAIQGNAKGGVWLSSVWTGLAADQGLGEVWVEGNRIIGNQGPGILSALLAPSTVRDNYCGGNEGPDVEVQAGSTVPRS
jgi:hypothetical protein